MTDRVRIQLFGGLHIYINHESQEQIIAKSKKGSALLAYLIAEHGAVVPNQKLISVLWSEESTNPENALKTLISRYRVLLNQLSDGLGGCIQAGRGGYAFHAPEHVTVDLYEFEALAKRLGEQGTLTETNEKLYQQALELYAGDLLAGGEQDEWMIVCRAAAQQKYLALVSRYIDLLKQKERYDDVLQVCRVALEADPFSEKLHTELMQALVKQGRSNEALEEYKHVSNMHIRYLGDTPPEGIQALYKEIIRTSSAMDMNIDAIRAELMQPDNSQGALECDYTVFREIYQLQMRNLERLGSSMYIALVMISGIDGEPINPIKLDGIMRGLGEVIKAHLRKGDTLTHFSPSQYALLLPTVNIESGKMVLERIKRFFYQRYSDPNIMFSYRIGAASSGLGAQKFRREPVHSKPQRAISARRRTSALGGER